MVRILILACAALAACEPPPSPGRECADGDPDQERRGTDCLCCHQGEFGVAGSVDPAGPPVARVVVTDGFGRSADMVPNPYGNFFRHIQLEPPLVATLFAPDGRSVTMRAPIREASCNRCHRAGGEAAPLRGP